MISTKTLSTPLLLVLFFAFTTNARGALVLVINPDDKTFAFEGSDSGMPGTSVYNGLIDGSVFIWDLNRRTSGSESGTGLNFRNRIAFTTAVGSPGGRRGLDRPQHLA